jgi:hypothetical protein
MCSRKWPINRESYKLREGDNERGIAARLTLEAMASNSKRSKLQSADQLSAARRRLRSFSDPHRFSPLLAPRVFYLVGLVCKGVGATSSGAIRVKGGGCGGIDSDATT